MIRGVDDLYNDLLEILKNSGFDDSAYVIQKHEECVAIFFEMKEAVEYFKVDFLESKLAEDCMFEYKKVRNKHAAYIYSW